MIRRIAALSAALVLGWSTMAGATSGHEYTCHGDEGCHETTTTRPTTTTTTRPTTTTTAPATTTTAPAPTTTTAAPTTTTAAPTTTTTPATTSTSIGLERAPWWPGSDDLTTATVETGPPLITKVGGPTPVLVAPGPTLPHTGAETRRLLTVAGASISLGWAIIITSRPGSRTRQLLRRIRNRIGARKPIRGD